VKRQLDAAGLPARACTTPIGTLDLVGSLTGFGGGLALKRRLLDLEADQLRLI
jgi:hypothetical protein